MATWWRSSPQLGGREVALAALAGALLAVVLFWPLPLHLGTDIPLDLGDPLVAGWQVAWGGHALATPAARLLPGQPVLAAARQPRVLRRARRLRAGRADRLAARTRRSSATTCCSCSRYALALPRRVPARAGARARPRGRRRSPARRSRTRPGGSSRTGTCTCSPAAASRSRCSCCCAATAAKRPGLVLARLARSPPGRSRSASPSACSSPTCCSLLGAIALVSWLARRAPGVARRLVVGDASSAALLFARGVARARAALHAGARRPPRGPAHARATVARYSGPPRDRSSPPPSRASSGARRPRPSATGCAPCPSRRSSPGLAIVLLALAGLGWRGYPRPLRIGLGARRRWSSRSCRSGSTRAWAASTLPPALRASPGWQGIRVARAAAHAHVARARAARGRRRGQRGWRPSQRRRGRRAARASSPARWCSRSSSRARGSASAATARHSPGSRTRPCRSRPRASPGARAAAAPARRAGGQPPLPAVVHRRLPEDGQRAQQLRAGLLRDVLSATAVLPGRASVTRLREIGVRTVVVHSDRPAPPAARARPGPRRGAGARAASAGARCSSTASAGEAGAARRSARQRERERERGTGRGEQHDLPGQAGVVDVALRRPARPRRSCAPRIRARRRAPARPSPPARRRRGADRGSPAALPWSGRRATPRPAGRAAPG